MRKMPENWVKGCHILSPLLSTLCVLGHSRKIEGISMFWLQSDFDCFFKKILFPSAHLISPLMMRDEHEREIYLFKITMHRVGIPEFWSLLGFHGACLILKK